MGTKRDDTNLTRALRVIRYLQMPHTINDIAIHFEVSRRTAFRYLDKIQNAGVVLEKRRSLMMITGMVTYQLKSL